MAGSGRLVCPHCDERPVEATTRSLRVRDRRLFGHRVQGRRLVGCTRCLRRELLGQVRRSLARGWGGVTAALVNPFVIVHDLGRLLAIRRDPGAVSEHLDELGVGGAPGEVDVRDVAYALAASVSHADGRADPREIEAAVDAGRTLLPGFDEERLRTLWDRHAMLPSPLDLAPLLRDVLDRGQKEAVLDFLLEIARADRQLDPREDALLVRVARAMGLDVFEWRSRSLGRLAERMAFGGSPRPNEPGAS